MMRLKRVIEGLNLILIGLVFLANATGALSWRIWLTLLSLWPLLVIAAGVDIIGKATRQWWLRVSSSLILLAGLLFAIFAGSAGNGLPWNGVFRQGESTPFEISHPADPRIETASLDVKSGAGTIDIGAGSELVTGSGVALFGAPTFDVGRSGTAADVSVIMGDEGLVWGFQGEPSLELRLSRDVVWDVTVDTGVSRLEADFSEVPISALDVHSGISGNTVWLGEVAAGQGEVPVTVDVAMSTLTIRVPRDAQVRIEMPDGINDVKVPSEFDKIDDRSYQTARFDRRDDRYRVRIESAIANIRVETY